MESQLHLKRVQPSFCPFCTSVVAKGGSDRSLGAKPKLWSKIQLVENLSTKLEESTGVYHLLYGFSVIVACGFICQVSRPLCFTSVRGACGLNESALL